MWAVIGRVHQWDLNDITGYTLLDLSSYTCIVGLGDRWAPAVINSAFELILIHEIQKRMDTLSYWISGSTDSRDGAPVTFYEYMPNLNG